MEMLASNIEHISQEGYKHDALDATGTKIRMQVSDLNRGRMWLWSAAERH